MQVLPHLTGAIIPGLYQYFPVCRFGDLLKDENLLPEDYTEEDLDKVFEDPDVLSDEHFYSLYYYSKIVLSQVPGILEQFGRFSEENKELEDMMIIRNEIPILEYDDSSLEVIPPDHDWSADQLPEKCLFAFLGDVVHEYAHNNDAKVVETLITVSHDIKIYVLHETEEDICLVQSPIGAAASAQVLDTLVSCGCKKVIAVGSCGVLANLPEDAFIVPTKALRAEGTSYHYLPASRYIELDREPISVIEETFKKHGLPFVTCTTWSTDGFFRETRDMVQYRLQEGCSVVEMESAALAACCRKRGAMFGQFLFTADSLANVHEYDAREFGTKSHEKALLLGLDILRNYRTEGTERGTA